MIFINPYDEFKAKWVGAPLSVEEVTNISGIKHVRYLDSFYNVLLKTKDEKIIKNLLRI